jgi:uncharacterized SAM-binding protein YcdF (DUF218 family)
MSRGLAGLLEHLIGPPGGPLLIMIVGLLLWRSRAQVGKWVTLSGIGLLYLSSLHITALGLTALLETTPALSKAEISAPRARAIVILGASRRENAAEFTVDSLNAAGLERVRYGAWLARQTGLPILVSGGLSRGNHPSEAELMRATLQEEFGITVRWLEGESRTTYENARYSAALLQGEGIDTVYVVTHALHIPRAMWSFQKSGLQAIAAPTVFESDGTISLHSFLPNAHAMASIARVFHELAGLVWYRLRY